MPRLTLRYGCSLLLSLGMSLALTSQITRAAEAVVIPTTRPAVKHPAVEVAMRYHDAVKSGNQAASDAELATFTKPVPDIARRFEKLGVKFKAETTRFVVYDVHAQGDIAVAIVGVWPGGNSKTLDTEEWYLIRQGDTWKLLPNFRDYERPEYDFAEPRMEGYKKLEEWVAERMHALRKEMTGCDC